MARINVPDGEGLERIRVWKLQPDVGMGMGVASNALYTKISLDVRVLEIADDCPINQTDDPTEDPSSYVHG